jgi:hypothetical protein
MSDHFPHVRFVEQRATPCLARLGRVVSWSRILALRTGSAYVGVRVDSPTTATLLERCLAPLRAPHLDAVAPPNFSLRLGCASQTEGTPPHGGTGPRTLGLVYRDHEIVARRESPSDLVRDLVALLESTDYHAQHDLLALRCAALGTRRGAVVLLPSRWYRALVPHQRRLANQAGLDLLPGEVHLIDVERLELVLPAMLPVDERWPEAARPITRWGLLCHGVEAPCTLRPAQGVHAGFQAVANLSSIGPREALRALGCLSREVELVALPEAPSTTAVATAGVLAHSSRLPARG